MVERRLIAVEGVVQGVGFRPYVFSLATRLDLRGFVRNDAAGVLIDIEGERPALDDFVQTLTASPPPRADIHHLQLQAAPPESYATFAIAPSEAAPAAGGTGGVAVVAPDAATCDACVAELFDPAGRRHRYPFVTCTACGPRLTIARGSPYDRARTTMAGYPLCGACAAEYADPQDRRFHAESLACADCGPRLEWRAGGAVLSGEAGLQGCIEALRSGAIVALKGLGGFHLACAAHDAQAVAVLRLRKRRDAKPFAIMVRDVAAARALCHVDPAEAALLEGSARPIVLLRRLPPPEAEAGAAAVAVGVAPELTTLGVMLPYTPLHHLLLRETGPLVMTSGNLSDEPLVHENDAALASLAAIADAFLLHDRGIAVRCDDSVAAVIAGAPTVLRRSRGCAPQPFTLTAAAAAPLVAVGGHLKNTFCLARGHQAFVSQHIGDLGSHAAYRALADGIAHYAALFDATPRVAVHDLHPDYASTRLAAKLPVEARIGVQHHHAHVASCLAEHGADGPVIGVAFDGTGLGTDGAIWGGEFLLVEGASFQRLAHLSYVPLPGGDAAVRHPWRTAVAYLHAAHDGALDECADLPPLAAADSAQTALLRQLLDRRLHAPPTSSAGRLFDAVAAIAGVRQVARFEAQPAMALEALAGDSEGRAYPVELSEAADGWIIETTPIIRAVAADVRDRTAKASIAARFHTTLRNVIVAGAVRIRARTGVRRVALTGGIFQNRRLAGAAAAALDAHGFEVLLHRRIPCNDGGLSLGQAWIAARARAPN